MLISGRDLGAVQNLWRDLRGFAAPETDGAVDFCLDGIGRVIGCSNLTWIEAKRESDESDTLRGWRPFAQRTQHIENEAKRRATVTHYMEGGVFDPLTVGMTLGAGATRAHLRREIVGDRAWLRSWLYNEVLRPHQVEEMLVGAQATSPSREFYICIDRGPGDPAFGDRERDLLQLFLSGCPAFGCEVPVSREAREKMALLSRRERDVLRLLLTDLSEKEIAAQLAIGGRTAHGYTVSILRKFGVKGRIGLMAFWLRDARSDEFR